MNKVLTFTKLDFITVKPYFTPKNLLPLILVAVFLSFTNGGGRLIMSFVVVLWSVTFASYPFTTGEQNNIDALYCTLAVSREHVVGGRYLYTLCIDILGAAAAFALISILSAVNPAPTGEALPIVGQAGALGVVLIFVTLVQAIQLPLYFKLGYAKSKLLAMLPLFMFAVIVGAGSFVIEDGFGNAVSAAVAFFSEHTASVLLIALGVWIGAMFVSYLLSLRFYRKREF